MVTDTNTATVITAQSQIANSREKKDRTASSTNAVIPVVLVKKKRIQCSAPHITAMHQTATRLE
jgi:hypothetical protein